MKRTGTPAAAYSARGADVRRGLAQQHGVNLDGHAEGAHERHGLVHARGDVPRAGDGLEPLGPRRVQADVDAVQSGLGQGWAVFREQEAVRRHRDLLDAGDALERAHEVRRALPDERLAARYAEVPEAERGEDTGEAQEFLIAEHVLVRDLPAAVRHTVFAPQIAPVGYRNAQIIYVTPVFIQHCVSPEVEISALAAVLLDEVDVPYRHALVDGPCTYRRR